MRRSILCLVRLGMTEWKTVPFDDAFKDVTSKGNKIPQDSFQRFGKYPIIDQGESFIAGYLDDESLAWKENLPVVIFGDHTRILKFIDFRFVLGADGTKVLKPSKDLIPKFAYYSLLHLNIPSAGYSRHFRFLKDSEISFPLQNEQERIALILDKTDRLRRQCLFAQTLLDSFLQSVFIKMFGDPVSNPMSWDDSLLGRACVPKDGIRAGPFGSSIKKESYSETGYRVYGQEQVIVDNYRIGNYRISEKKFQQMKAYAVQPDDVLISLVGTFGKVSIVPKDAELGIINPRLIRIRLNQNKLRSQFFVAMFRNQAFSRKMEVMSHGGTMGVLNGTQLKETEIIIPPLPLQEKFAAIVQKFECVRRQQREATRQAEHLFQTLLHRAFRGEL